MQLIICVHSWLELETTVNLDMDVPVVYMVEYMSTGHGLKIARHTKKLLTLFQAP